MWEPGTKPWSSVRAANILSTRTISRAPYPALLRYFCLLTTSSSPVAEAQIKYAAKIGLGFLTQLLSTGMIAECRQTCSGRPQHRHRDLGAETKTNRLKTPLLELRDTVRSMHLCLPVNTRDLEFTAAGWVAAQWQSTCWGHRRL